MYSLLGISLTFAFLLIVNMAVAIFISLLWRVISGPVQDLSVGSRAKILFGLRIFPVAAALIFVLAFIVPAYVLHEPEDSGEVVSTKLALIAILCLAGAFIAGFRVFKTWLVTRRLVRNWLLNSTEITVAGVGLPIRRIEHSFPVLAVIGIIRPRIFVAKKVLESLGDAELRAAIAHEYGHLRAKDNLKRTLLRVCRDLVILPIGKELDIAWAQDAEIVADEHAAAAAGVRALDLASALIKLSRIVPDGSAPTLPVGAYIITDRDGDVSSRIRRLLKLSERKALQNAAVTRLFSVPGYVWSLGGVVLLLLHLADQRLLLTTHRAIESFIWIIQ